MSRVAPVEGEKPQQQGSSPDGEDKHTQAVIPIATEIDLDGATAADDGYENGGFFEIEIEDQFPQDEASVEEPIPTFRNRGREFCLLVAFGFLVLIVVDILGWAYAASLAKGNSSDDAYPGPSPAHDPYDGWYPPTPPPPDSLDNIPTPVEAHSDDAYPRPPPLDPLDDTPTPEEAQCGVNPYSSRNYSPTSCLRIRQGTNVNSYWDNDLFTCRLNRRPCNEDMPRVSDYHLVEEPSPNELEMDLGEQFGNLHFAPGGEGGVSEVWLVYADTEGRPVHEKDWKGNFQFVAEDRWYNEYIDADVNDYKFGTLECSGFDEEDLNPNRLYLIIDGVLVDSCPKSIAESCRLC